MKGKDQHPVYQWLTMKQLNGVSDASISWNFNKILVSPEGKYYECLGYSSVRKGPNPIFQNSIRKLSVAAFEKILFDAGLSVHANFNNWIA